MQLRVTDCGCGGALVNQASIAQWAVGNLRERMRVEGIGACIVADPVNVTYLSGHVIGGLVGLANTTAYVLLTDEDAVLVAPASAGFQPPDWLRLLTYEDYAIAHTVNVPAAALEAFEKALFVVTGAGKVAAELGQLPAAAYQSLNACRGVESVVDVRSILRALRAVKSPHEVEAIRRSVRACDRIFATIAEVIGEGSTELDVYVACVEVVAQEAGGPAILDGDFVSGERTEEIGGKPTARALRRGDLLILDVYPRLGAYWADVTRTYVVGESTPAQVQRHALLEEALAAGERAIRPGLPTKELYHVVKGVFDRAGLGERFPHHAGHCVGLTPSEDPRIIPGSNAILQEGMVITLEPGLYVPGEGGMRLEDNYVVTKAGFESLSEYPKKLISLGEQ